MKKVGIVLLALQAIAAIGGISSGSAPFLSIASAADIFKVLGYFCPAIIGVILIVKANKKEEAAKAKDISVGAHAVKTGAADSAKAVCCSKCGKTAEPEDVYCVHCGTRLKGR